MSFDWRTQSSETLERHYNPRIAIPNAEALIGALPERAAAARAQIEGDYDRRYGEDPKQTYDLHRAAGSDLGDPPPAFVFIHGGYWRALDKSDNSYVAPAFVKAGISVISANYDLCPDVSLDDIVRQMRELIVHVHAQAGALGIDADRLYLAGHSAGAHLAAMMLAEDWTRHGLPADVIKGAGCLSGIYEPGVVMRISVNEDIRLDEAMAARNDCIQHPPHRPLPMVVAAGAAETEGWIAQTRSYAEACRKAGCAVEEMACEGNHLSMLDACVTAGAPAYEAMLAQIKAL